MIWGGRRVICFVRTGLWFRALLSVSFLDLLRTGRADDAVWCVLVICAFCRGWMAGSSIHLCNCKSPFVVAMIQYCE